MNELEKEYMRNAIKTAIEFLKPIIYWGIVLIVLLALIKYTEKPIDHSYQCIGFRLDEEVYEEIEVKISGAIKKSLLRKDRAELDVQIGGKYSRKIEWDMERNKDYNIVLLRYSNDSYQSYGTLYLTKNTQDILIVVPEKSGSRSSWSSQDGYVITSQKDIELGREMMEDILISLYH